MKRLFTFFALISLYSSAFAQSPEILWDMTESMYSGNSNEIATAVIQMPNEDFIVAGSIENYNPDWFIYRTDKDGNTIWYTNFTGNGTNDGTDRVWDILADGDTTFFTLGESSSSTIKFRYNNGGTDVLIAKYGISGSILETEFYGGSTNDKAYAMTYTHDGNIAIIGNTMSSDGTVESSPKGLSDVWLLILNKDCEFISEHRFGGSNYDYGYDIIPTSDNGYLVVGKSSSSDGDIPTSNKGDFDVFILKLDANFNKKWANNLGGAGNDAGYSVVEATDGNYIISGETSSRDQDVKNNINTKYGEASTELWVIKVNKSDGSIVWEKTFGGSEPDGEISNNDKGSSIIKLQNNTYAIATNAASTDGDLTGIHLPVQESPSYTFNFKLQDQWIINIDELGNKIWQKCMGTTNDDRAYDLIETKDDQLVVAGMVTNSLMDDWIWNEETREHDYDLSGNGDGILDQDYSVGDISEDEILGEKDTWLVKLKITECNSVTITEQSTTQNLTEGEALELSVTATGDAPISYQWMFNDVTIEGATSSTYSIASVSTENQGVYKCIVSNECSEASSNNITAFITTGIDDFTTGNIEIYPNPTKGEVTIKLLSNSTVSLMDIVGNTILSTTLSKGKHQLNISEQPQGVYFIKVQTDKNTFTHRLIIQ